MRRSARLAAPAVAAACIAAALGAWSAPAPAAKPTGPGGIGSSNLPIDVTSDNYDYDQKNRVAVYTGNVEAVQGTARLRSPKLTIYFAPKDPNAPKPPPGADQADVGQVERIEAEGPVHYTTPTQRALGDHGTYIADNRTITLTGNVTVVQDKNVGSGDKLIIEQDTGRQVLTSNPGKTQPQRVRTVLYPNQNNTTPPGQAAKPNGHP